MTKQAQQGGDCSTNIQAGNIITYVGIDEQRAREICREMTLQLRKEYTQEAYDIASARVLEFESKLVTRMEEVNGALEAFADPGFQILLTNAQKAAASSDRTSDYDLLSELLLHRFKNSNDRSVIAGVNVAVDVVDKVSDEALLGLTVSHAISYFRPLDGDIMRGLDALDGLFGKITYADLPVGMEWLDHLDILNIVRISSFGSLKKLDQLYTKRLDGYSAVGIEHNSDTYHKALEILTANKISANALVKHDLNEGYVRISVSNESDIENLYLNIVTQRNGLPVSDAIPLTHAQIDAFKSVYKLYSTEQSAKNRVLEALRKELDKRQNLKQIREWWDAIPSAFDITSAGKVLAHTNAQRCDSSLPPLN